MTVEEWKAHKLWQASVLRKWAGDEREARRAGGDMRCAECGRLYYDHPKDGPGDNNGDKYLNRICDGRLVKL